MNGKNDFLLDTNVILGFLNGNTKIDAFFRSNALRAALYISQISRMELLGYPEITAQEEQNLKSFLSYTTIIPITDDICDQTIQLRKQIKLKLPDALIAATAIKSKLILVTCDSDLLDRGNHFHSINPMTL